MITIRKRDVLRALSLLIVPAVVFTVAITTMHPYLAAAGGSACETANNKFIMNTPEDPSVPKIYTNFYQLGGTGDGDKGVSWACNSGSGERGISVLSEPDNFATSMGNGKYTLNVNVAIDPGNPSQKVGLPGLIHYDSNWGPGAYGHRMMLCLTRPDPAGDGVLTMDEVGCGNNGIFTGYSVNTLFQRGIKSGGGGRDLSAYGGWTNPDPGMAIGNIYVDGTKLMQAIKEKRNGIEADFYEGNGDAQPYYLVKIYNYRCFYPYTSSGHCGSSPMYVTILQDSPKGCLGGVRSYTDGENVAIMRLENLTNGQNKDSSSNGGPYSSSSFRSNLGHIYAKPGDQLHYEYQLCANAEKANRYLDIHTGERKRIPRTCGEDEEGPCTKLDPNPDMTFDTEYDISAYSIAGSKGYFHDYYDRDSWYMFGMPNGPHWNNDTYDGRGNGYLFGMDGLDLHSPKTSSSSYGCPGNTTAGEFTVPTGDNCNSWHDVTGGELGRAFRQKVEWNAHYYQGGSYRGGSSESEMYADVYVPYNYKVKLNLTAPTRPQATVGERIEFSAHMSIENRQNSDVSSTAYATTTKKTDMRVWAWYMDPDSNLSDLKRPLRLVGSELSDGTGFVGNAGVAAIELPYKAQGGSGDASINYINNREFAPNSAVTVEGSFVPAKLFDPLQLRLGGKICIAVGATPGDSHDRYAEPDVAGYNEISVGSPAYNSDYGKWILSEPNCFTLSKKPSVKIGGGSYIENEISTSITKQYYKNLAPGSLLYKWSAEPAMFGSWVDTSLVSGGANKGLASGASLFGGVPVNTAVNTSCYLSSMTFTNNRCDSAVGVGNFGSQDYPSMMVTQLKNRFTSSAVSAEPFGSDSNNPINPAGYCAVGSSSGNFISKKYDNYGNAIEDNDFECTHNGTRYLHSNAPVAVVGRPNHGWVGIFGPGSYGTSMGPVGYGGVAGTGMQVIEGDSTVVISSDIYYGSAGDEITQSDWDKLLDDVFTMNDPIVHTQEIENIFQLPQFMIIAPRVVITPEVINLDAWILADELVTCGDLNGNTITDIDANKCNRPLTINGPVFTKYLTLNRTHGAGRNNSGQYTPGTGDWNQYGREVFSRPAERFNIGPETTLWAATQSMRFSHASVTYMNELPPRY